MKRLLLAIATATACALGACDTMFAADEQGKTVTVSATPPFKITLPAGWKPAAEPVTLDTIVTGAGLSVLMQFGELGAMDAEAAKKKASSEAQMFLVGSGDDRNAAAPEATAKQIAGNKGFAISASYASGGKPKQLRFYAFTVDGKNYEFVSVQAPEDKLGGVDAMISSIAAAK